MPIALPLFTVLAFAALTLALAALWAPLAIASRHARYAWALPCAAAIVLALSGRLVDARGLLMLLTFAASCAAARSATGPAARGKTGRAAAIAAHAVMLVLCAGFFLHVIPGFDNPRVLSDVVLGPGSEPYTKYLNFDKGIAGVFLLGLYAPDRLKTDEGARHVGGFLWRFAILVAAVMLLSIAAGYVRWDPKLPAWWPMWIWSMVCLTALPEEALFRALTQTSLERWMGAARLATPIAIVVAGALFGVAHLAGGPAYVVLASAAGLGYGWIYAATRSIGGAILAHAGLNTVHLLFFSYPALLR